MAQDEGSDTPFEESVNESGQVEAPPADADTEADGSTANKSEGEIETLRKQYDTLEKRYRDIQGWDTKVAQENAQLKAQLDLLQSQITRNVSAETAAREQDDFDKRWREEIDANPSKAIDFFRGMAKELKETAAREAKAEIERLKADLEETRQSLDPAYQQHRETVDRLVRDYGLDRKTATALAAKELKAAQQATQPRAAVPGRTASAGAGGYESPQKQMTPTDPGIREVWRLLGIKDEKVQSRIRKEA